jgi:hypothetical protein
MQSRNEASYQTTAQLDGRADQDGHIPLGAFLDFLQKLSNTVRKADEIVKLTGRFPATAELLEEAGPDILAFTALRKEVWRQIWSNNLLERLNREIRRRTDVVGIFPKRAAEVAMIAA